MLKPISLCNPALATSCPNLLVEGGQDNTVNNPSPNQTAAKRLPFISNMLGTQFGVTMDIVISSAEAEDIEEDSTSFSSNMLPRSRQRSQSLDRVSEICMVIYTSLVIVSILLDTILLINTTTLYVYLWKCVYYTWLCVRLTYHSLYSYTHV